MTMNDMYKYFGSDPTIDRNGKQYHNCLKKFIYPRQRGTLNPWWTLAKEFTFLIQKDNHYRTITNREISADYR